MDADENYCSPALCESILKYVPFISGLINEVAAAIKSVICYNEHYYFDSGALVELLRCESDEDIGQWLIEQGNFAACILPLLWLLLACYCSLEAMSHY